MASLRYIGVKEEVKEVNADKGKKFIGLDDDDLKKLIMFSNTEKIDDALNRFLSRFERKSDNTIQHKTTFRDASAYQAYLIVFYLNSYARYAQLIDIYQKLRIQVPSMVGISALTTTEQLRLVLEKFPRYKIIELDTTDLSQTNISSAKVWGKYNGLMTALANALYYARLNLIYGFLRMKEEKIDWSVYGLNEFELPFEYSNRPVLTLDLTPWMDQLQKINPTASVEPSQEEEPESEPSKEEESSDYMEEESEEEKPAAKKPKIDANDDPEIKQMQTTLKEYELKLAEYQVELDGIQKTLADDRIKLNEMDTKILKQPQPKRKRALSNPDPPARKELVQQIQNKEQRETELKKKITQANSQIKIQKQGLETLERIARGTSVSTSKSARDLTGLSGGAATTLRATGTRAAKTQTQQRARNMEKARQERLRRNFQTRLTGYVEVPRFENIPFYETLAELKADVRIFQELGAYEKLLFETFQDARQYKNQPNIQALVINFYYQVELIRKQLERAKPEVLRTLATRYYEQAKSLINNFQSVQIIGDPGVGKTTIAKIYQRLRYALGIDVILERESSNGANIATTGFSGQASILAEEFMNDCIGSTKFIDEFYAITSGTNKEFGIDFLNVMVYYLSEPPGLRTIIVGGYPREVEKTTGENKGILRRIQYTWRLSQPTIVELAEFFVKEYWFVHIRNLFPRVDATLFKAHLVAIFGLLSNPNNKAKKNFIQDYNYALAKSFEVTLVTNMNQLLAIEPQTSQDTIDHRNDEQWNVNLAKLQSLSPTTKPITSKNLFWGSSLNFDDKLALLDQTAYSMLDIETTELYVDRRYAYETIMKTFIYQITQNKINISFDDSDYITRKQAVSDYAKKPDLAPSATSGDEDEEMPDVPEL